MENLVDIGPPKSAAIKGCSIIYAPAGQAGEYAPLATNPYRGCGNGCAYCLAPETPVRLLDGTEKPIGEIQLGDDLIGLDEGRGLYIKSTVLAILESLRLALRITFEDGGSVKCSADHRWLMSTGSWKTTDLLTPGDSILAREWDGAIISRRSHRRVVSVKAVGEKLLVDITTSTETFLANGMVSHNCYVPSVLRMDRREFDQGAVPRQDFLKNLIKDARKYQAAGITEQVMLSFTTDPYPPEQHLLTRQVLEVLRDHGMGFCTLTKGGSRALRDLDLFRPDRDAFASTLTSLDDAFSRKWERNAVLPGDRIATLKAFHDAGIFTWVSLEPTLDTESSLAIVEATHTFVDLFKIGRANYLPMTNKTDWEAYTHRMVELTQRLGANTYIKKDLQKYLPPGFHNPLRVPQHH